MQVVCSGDKEFVRWLLDRGVSVDAQTDEGRETALMWIYCSFHVTFEINKETYEQNCKSSSTHEIKWVVRMKVNLLLLLLLLSSLIQPTSSIAVSVHKKNKTITSKGSEQTTQHNSNLRIECFLMNLVHKLLDGFLEIEVGHNMLGRQRQICYWTVI
jgi:hypothetical protein